MPEALAPFAVLLVVVATGAAGWALWQAGEARREAALAFLRAETRMAEILRLQKVESQLHDVQRMTEAAVAGGTQAVQAVHKGIAAIPFGILEAIPATRDTTRVVRVTHDAIAGTVYGAIGAVNKGIGSLLRAGINSETSGRNAALPTADPQQDDPGGRPPDKE